jgi:hypothetical protein
VTTDDLAYVEEVLQSIAQTPVQHVEKIVQTQLVSERLLFTYDDQLATAKNWQMLKDRERTLVFVNCQKSSAWAVDAGWLTPPPELLRSQILHPWMSLKEAEPYVPVFKGMSLKASEELLLYCSAKYKSIAIKHVREAKKDLGRGVQGLQQIDTQLEFYDPQGIPEFLNWVEVNRPYFLSPKVPHDLVPRGLAVNGPPGTGKTMLARYLANSFGVPLYHLDISATLTKYIGESESRLAQQLQLLDKESPCVVLIDEVEKIFTTSEDQSVLQRMLSQLLWWLQEHHSRVLTIMTSNDITKVPPELYRPGRMDMVLTIPALTGAQANEFRVKLLTHYLGSAAVTGAMCSATWYTGGSPQYSHAHVKAQVIKDIREKHWLPY